MIIRSGSPPVRLGADPIDYRASEESKKDFFNSLYYNIPSTKSITGSSGRSYANAKDKTYAFSSIENDSEFSEALFAAITSGVLSNAEAEEIRRFRFNKTPTDLKDTVFSLPGGTSGPIPDSMRESYLASQKPTDNRSDTKKFLDWLDCSKADGGKLVPDSWARNACYARNAVLGIALVAGVVGLLFVTRQLSSD